MKTFREKALLKVTKQTKAESIKLAWYIIDRNVDDYGIGAHG